MNARFFFAPWFAQYRRFWRASLDRLAEYLRRVQAGRNVRGE